MKMTQCKIAKNIGYIVDNMFSQTICGAMYCQNHRIKKEAKMMRNIPAGL
jgi:hypothetical protein